MTNTSPTDGRHFRRVSRIWERMKAYYGHRWEMEYGTAGADGEFTPISKIWADVLADAKDEQIAAAIKHCLERESQHPPTLPEFYRMCAVTARPAERYEPSPLRFSEIYSDPPTARCANMAARLAEQAADDLLGVRCLPDDARNAATKAYWISKMGGGLFAAVAKKRLEQAA